MAETFVWPDFAIRDPAADRVLEAVREAARREGHAEGFARGREEGLAAAAAEIEAMQRAQAEALAELDGTVRDGARQQIDRLARLLEELCTQVLGRALVREPELFETVLHAALDRLCAGAEAAEVVVNPADHDALAAHLDGRLPLRSDAGIPAGGFSVRLPDRAVDFDPAGEIRELLAACWAQVDA